MELQGKRAIVTGGVRGIGKEIVRQLMEHGVEVAVFDIDADGLKSLEGEITGVRPFECDLSKYDHVRQAVAECFDEFQSLDILVNNAGILYSAPLLSFSLDGLKPHDVGMWGKVIATNLDSVFYMTVSVVEKMVMRRTKGVVINISSISAAGNAGQSAYSAAKAGVNALTATWAKELASWGIRVVGIAPGFCETESTHAAMSQAALKEVLTEAPLKRLGSVSEIAEGVIFAIRNDFFTGKTLEIDGGLTV